MNRRLKTDATRSHRRSGIFYLLFALLLFLYYWLIIDPRLIYTTQRPAFFYDWSFMKNHLLYPGGPIEWVSCFITQFFTNRLFGALLLTGILLLFALCIRSLCRSIGRSAPMNCEWLAVAPILALSADYLLPSQHIISPVVLLFASVLFHRTAERMNVKVRGIVFFMLTGILYYIIGAPALALPLFILLQLNGRKADLVFLLFAVFIVPRLLFNVLPFDPSGLYTLGLPSLNALRQKLLYAAFWLLLILLLLIQRFSAKLKCKGLPLLFPATGLVIAYAALTVTFQPLRKVILQVDMLAEQRRWQSVLQLLDKHPEVGHRLTTLQRYRALFFTGRLGDRLFEHPMDGADGLYRSDKLSFEFPLVYCDLLIDLGNVNGALHKAYEAWAAEGETPRVLQRLAYLHLAKKEFSAAEKYLHRLYLTGKNREWMRKYSEICHSQCLEIDAELVRLSRFIERADFLMRPGFAFAELRDIVHVQPSRMAVEYLLAYELLAGRLDAFMKDLPLFLKISPELPQAYEEAVVLYLNSGLPITDDYRSIAVRRSTVESFARFMQILRKHNNDKQSSFSELRRTFGKSFWFYFLYMNKGEAK